MLTTRVLPTCPASVAQPSELVDRRTNRIYGGTGWQRLAAVVVSVAVCAVPTIAIADALAAADDAHGLVSLRVVPEHIQLVGPRDKAQVLVTGVFSDGSERDLSRQASIESLSEGIVVVDGTTVKPAADGRTQLRVSFADHRLELPVDVSRFPEPHPISFAHEAMALFTRQGCNSGGCHGAPSGKAEFRLSLFAFDPNLDAKTVVLEEASRRINRIEPEKSLLLRKPLMRLPHGGGKRLHEDSEPYQVLLTWISEGCRVDWETAPAVDRLDVSPQKQTLLLTHSGQQLVVRALLSDGNSRDVTHLSTFVSSDDAVAKVNADGFVKGLVHGEVSIIVRYLDNTATTQLTLIDPDREAATRLVSVENYIDERVNDKLKLMRFSASPRCSDEQFVRRVYLDTLGLLPSVEEARAFVNDSSPTKRASLIDELLERPEHAVFWATKWADLLRVQNEALDSPGVQKMHRWLVSALLENRRYDQMVREILLAEGDSHENPMANYYRALDNAEECIEATAQVFMGVRLQCAKCHNHPYENWKQDDYYQMGAFFERIRRTEASTGSVVVWADRSGDTVHPRTGEISPPRLPNVKTDVAADDATDRRHAFVGWLTDKENAWFARVEANRIWAHALGRGIVDPIDDFRASNPPANAELLAALTQDFITHDFDRKHLLRTILQSGTYQLSSLSDSTNREDQKYFSHYPMHRLTAEQLYDALTQFTGLEKPFDKLPTHIRATQLPGPQFANEFMRSFGKPDRNTSCACERRAAPDLSQVFQLATGETVRDLIATPSCNFRLAQQEGQDRTQIIDDIYWAAYARAPLTDERVLVENYLEKADVPAEALEDLVWSIINSKEFTFQH